MSKTPVAVEPLRRTEVSSVNSTLLALKATDPKFVVLVALSSPRTTSPPSKVAPFSTTIDAVASSEILPFETATNEVAKFELVNSMSLSILTVTWPSVPFRFARTRSVSATTFAPLSVPRVAAPPCTPIRIRFSFAPP